MNDKKVDKHIKKILNLADKLKKEIASVLLLVSKEGRKSIAFGGVILLLDSLKELAKITFLQMYGE